jgi:hypothetical protein
MKKLFGCLVLALAALAPPGYAQTCTNWPNLPDQLMDGNPADAAQVMYNYNFLALCAAPLASPVFSGNVGIGMTGGLAALNLGGNISAPSWTTTGVDFAANSATYTDTSGSGTINSRVINSFGLPTLASSSAETITNAATLYIAGAPIAGGSTTITNALGLWVDGGLTRLDGFNGFGGVTPTAVVEIGGSQMFASWTIAGRDLYIAGNTLTDTSGSGTIGTRVASSIQAPTFAASNTETITNAVTLYIAGPPSAGGSTTITNALGLWVNGGITRLDGLNGFGGVTPTAVAEIGGSQMFASWNTAGRDLYVAANTLTDTSGSGTIATRVASSFQVPTFAASNTETITNAATVYIAGAPSAGGDTTITNALALDIAAGISYFGGNVGIGTASPAYLLNVGSSSSSGIVLELQNSSGACTHTPGSMSETVSCSSDVRLKKDIVDASAALPALDDMRVRDFTIRATGERKTGVIAQEMLKNHPDMVHMGPDGFYKVDEPNPWKLVKAIQELKAANDAQAAQIERANRELAGLRQENALLKSNYTAADRRLDALEARVGIRAAANENSSLRSTNVGRGE